MDNDAGSAVAVPTRGGAVVTTCDHDHDGTMAVDNHQRKRRDFVDGILRLVRFEKDRGNDESYRTRNQGKVGPKIGFPAGLIVEISVGLRVDGSVDGE